MPRLPQAGQTIVRREGKREAPEPSDTRPRTRSRSPRPLRWTGESGRHTEASPTTSIRWLEALGVNSAAKSKAKPQPKQATRRRQSEEGK
eukprot:1734979-Heterocapsa_arctica.AAC.1